MKQFMNRLKENNIKFTFTGTLSQCLILSFAICFFIECLSRQSISKTFYYFFTSPLVFIYNSLIILVTLSIAKLFKRRKFAIFIISMLWAVIGIANFVLLQFRTTPFTAVDLLLLKSVAPIIPHYLETIHYILLGIVFLLLIVASFIVFKKSQIINETIHYVKTLALIVMMTLSIFGLTYIGVWAGLLSENFGNLAHAFHDYGLPYCFASSVINTGIDRPKQYSKEVVHHIVDSVDKGVIVNSSDISLTESPKKGVTIMPAATSTPIPTKIPIDEIEIPKTYASKETPNIIMLQLESFFDPNAIIGIEFTSDPLLYFHYLKENFTYGYLNVPSVGAGTANTEFEAITGMNLDFFGPGEYPYKTILQSTTCESVNFNLKPLGYKTHAMHNNIATFYDRHIVFSQLGFDTFTSIEYMEEAELTPLGWAKDEMLVNEIQKVLESSESQDFIYAISVQGHGAYPTGPLFENPEIDLSLPENFSMETYYALLYYVNQIHEMDHFIQELISYLEQCGEETVLVLYGDHLPDLSLTSEQLENGSLFQTEYVMWSNFDLEIENKELETYQLYSYVFDRLDIHEGLIPKLHQTQQDSDIYLEQLKILEYDMLYGDLDCYGGINPHTATDLQMGTSKVSFYSFRAIEEDKEKSLYGLHIVGNNFNQYSRICINDKPIAVTNCSSKNLLTATNIELKPGDKISISQIGTDSRILSSSNAKYYYPDN